MGSTHCLSGWGYKEKRMELKLTGLEEEFQDFGMVVFPEGLGKNWPANVRKLPTVANCCHWSNFFCQGEPILWWCWQEQEAIRKLGLSPFSSILPVWSMYKQVWRITSLVPFVFHRCYSKDFKNEKLEPKR